MEIDKCENKKVSYIKSIIQELKKTFRFDRERHKITALTLKMSIAVMSALAMVLLGWQSPSESISFQNYAMVLNALITVIASYEAFFKPKKLWVRETKVFSELKDLERNFEFDTLDDTPSEESLAEYKDKINTILQNSMNEWLEDKKRDV